MVTNSAKKAMTTKGQKACLIIDHLVEALGSDPSCSLRRAMVLTDIAQNPGTTQAEIMQRLHLDKSTINRNIDWMYNYGCIKLHDGKKDKRTKEIQIYGYSKTALDKALVYFEGNYENLKIFLKEFIKFLRVEKPTLRDAKIYAALHEKGQASKQEIMGALYDGPTSTDNRAYKKLVEEGLIDDADAA